jgi:micrococcal nuclease
MRACFAILVLVALFVAGFPSVAVAQETLNGIVARVTDGDTVSVRLASGAPTRVRLIGIDAPESVDPEAPTECGAVDAAASLKQLAEGREVVLTTDPTQDRTDRFGRLLAYADVAGVDVGREMIRAGHAAVFVFAAPFGRLPSYQQAQDEARSAGRAVWGSCNGRFHTPASSSSAPTESRRESAERYVRRYYFLLNGRRFSTAWTKLSPGLRSRFGPYASWRSGFVRTLGTRVNAVNVALISGGAVVAVAIRARDRDACGGRVIAQFFRVRWVLSRRGDSWTATNLTARKRGGGTPRLSRSDCVPARQPRQTPRQPPRQTPAPSPACHPSYRPCVPNDRDYDCGELPSSDYVVTGPDDYRLDGDNDGIGCES